MIAKRTPRPRVPCVVCNKTIFSRGKKPLCQKCYHNPPKGVCMKCRKAKTDGKRKMCQPCIDEQSEQRRDPTPEEIEARCAAIRADWPDSRLCTSTKPDASLRMPRIIKAGFPLESFQEDTL